MSDTNSETPDAIWRTLPARPGARGARTMPEAEYQRRVALLSAPFPTTQIERKPQQIAKADKSEYARCEQGTGVSIDGYYCGGRHAKAVHITYVGHAGITMRLNEVDPQWYWEPLALDANGLPKIDGGSLWGRLYVLDLERIGVGDAEGGIQGFGHKIVTGDFLRNAAMRMGTATYLWSKSDAAATILADAPDVGPAQQEEANRYRAEALAIADTYPTNERIPFLRALAEQVNKHHLDDVPVGVPSAWVELSGGNLLLPLRRLLNGCARIEIPSGENPEPEQDNLEDQSND